METEPSFFDIFNYPIVWLFLAAYLIPAIVAISRNSAAWGLCLFVNLLFGWTLIGWIAAFVLACCPSKAEAAYRGKVKRARDEFYLREAEKAKAP